MVICKIGACVWEECDQEVKEWHFVRARQVYRSIAGSGHAEWATHAGPDKVVPCVPNGYGITLKYVALPMGSALGRFLVEQRDPWVCHCSAWLLPMPVCG